MQKSEFCTKPLLVVVVSLWNLSYDFVSLMCSARASNETVSVTSVTKVSYITLG